MFSNADLEIILKKEYNSADYIQSFWNVIEDKIFFNIGINKNIIATIFIDENFLAYSISSDKEIIYNKHAIMLPHHVITSIYEFTCTININITVDKYDCINYDHCSLYYYQEEVYDDVSIEIECDVCVDINSYKEFKSDFMFDLFKEFQYLIHLKVFENNIENDDNVYYQVLHDSIEFYRKFLDNSDFNNACKILLIKNKINKNDVDYLIKLNKKIINYNSKGN